MSLLHPSRRALAAALAASALIASPTVRAQTFKDPPASDFLTVYPGQWTARERSPVEAYLAENAALKARGPIDVAALVAGALPKNTPGVGPVIKVTEEWVRYNNGKYDPENPLRNDRAYASKAGYADILAYPTFGTNDDIFMIPYPAEARDRLLVTELNHAVTAYKPIYPGDTLYLVADERELLDLTPPEGDTYRRLAIQTKGSVYNQRGEKVNEVVFRVSENVRLYKDPAKVVKNPGFGDIWEAPPWGERRPAHIYTAADWDKIKDIWRKEERRGAVPRYWEDVKVGDQPAWTVDGPVIVSVSPIKPWGMGAGGSRTLKREILDPALAKSLVLSEADGIYRTRDRTAQVPLYPDEAPAAGGGSGQAGAIDTTRIHREGVTRSPLVNYMGREFAIRHITNWIGDQGWLETIRWGIMGPQAVALTGKTAPGNPRAEHFLDQVPHMKGRFPTTHGLTGDVAIVKSYVTRKYIRDGKGLADLVWWIETINGDIFEEGAATVILPLKTGG